MPGKLVHFELPAADSARAKAFWSGVFGWSFTDPMPDFEYSMVQTSDEQGGAVYPRQGEERGPIVYFDSDDIEASLEKVRANGGRADEKQPIPGVGWFARCTDTEGNDFSIYQRDQSVPAAQPE